MKDHAQKPDDSPGGPPALLPGPAPSPAEIDSGQLAPGEGWAVVLFNDDEHDMLEVVMAIVVATGFEHEVAWGIMMTAHQRGKAVVTITDKTEAEQVASVLRTAKLTVEIKAV